jgi:hypothetical protein
MTCAPRSSMPNIGLNAVKPGGRFSGSSIIADRRSHLRKYISDFIY